MTEPKHDDQSHLRRPKLNPKPSWIGRPASHRPDASKMTHKVRIEYRAPELQPPVYITTSLSEPQWDLLEMKVKHEEDGELLFHHEFEAVEGEYQYKFRLGPGDWWVCDESLPTIDDDMGNRNNILLVTPAELQPISNDTKKDSVVENSAAAPRSTELAKEHPVTDSDKKEAAAKHPAIDSAKEDAAAKHNANHLHTAAHDIGEPAVPLLKHETSYPGQIEDIPKDTVFHSPAGSPEHDYPMKKLWPDVDHNDPTLHRLKGRVAEASETQPSVESELRVSPQRSASALSTANLPKVQEETEIEEVVVVIAEEDGEVKEMEAVPENRHQKHHHHHPAIAQEDMNHEGQVNEKVKHTRSTVADLGEIFFGIVFAIVVAAVGLILYSTGMAQSDVVKDGGAALGG